MRARFSTLTASLFLWAATTIAAQALTITNPYEGVDWSIRPHRANLHTHTTESDGRLAPAEAIAAYRTKGYTILALSDHDRVSFPWTRFGRDPDALGMLAIQANELSQGHHTGSYFSDLTSRARSLADYAAEIGAAGGVGVVFHPGRYVQPPLSDQQRASYVEVYRAHPHMIGLEIVNQKDRYPGDRAVWDEILTALMPQRPVWAVANDDMHQAHHVGLNWTWFLLDQLDLDTFRQAFVGGRFYSATRTFTRSQQKSDDLMPPLITGLTVRERTITIQADNAEGIVWIAEGQEIHRGASLTIPKRDPLPTFVRAELYNPGGTTFTNPFGLVP